MVEVVRLSRSASITTGSCRELKMVSRGLLRKSATTGRAMKVMASISKRARPAFRATSRILEGMPMVSCSLFEAVGLAREFSQLEPNFENY
jgi:hypothetical protein